MSDITLLSRKIHFTYSKHIPTYFTLRLFNENVVKKFTKNTQDLSVQHNI